MSQLKNSASAPDQIPRLFEKAHMTKEPVVIDFTNVPMEGNMTPSAAATILRTTMYTYRSNLLKENVGGRHTPLTRQLFATRLSVKGGTLTIAPITGFTSDVFNNAVNKALEE